MLETFECPACGAGEWKTIADDVFSRDQRVKRPDQAKEAYVALRRRVLFEVWFPGADKIHLTTVMCGACGFMTYTPRPSAADIDAKYRMLQREERHIGTHHNNERLLAMDARRARRVFDTVTRHAGGDRLRVLDFGGGAGRMLQPFRDAGHDCFLVDYNVAPVAGVKKLGDTMDDLDEAARFDVIVCSHVIEHLAEPAAHVACFRHHLTPRGIVYGEVPMGIWRGIGIEDDPVTHINFFTTYSFGRLFERLGFRVSSLQKMVGQYTKRLDVIVAIGLKDDGAGSERLQNDGVAEARSLIEPSLVMDVARRIRLRRLPTLRGIARRIARH